MVFIEGCETLSSCKPEPGPAPSCPQCPCCRCPCWAPSRPRGGCQALCAGHASWKRDCVKLGPEGTECGRGELWDGADLRYRSKQSFILLRSFSDSSSWAELHSSNWKKKKKAKRWARSFWSLDRLFFISCCVKMTPFKAEVLYLMSLSWTCLWPKSFHLEEKGRRWKLVP